MTPVEPSELELLAAQGNWETAQQLQRHSFDLYSREDCQRQFVDGSRRMVVPPIHAGE